MTALSLTRVSVLALAVALISVPARAQSVDVDYDRTVDFRAYKTYNFGAIKMAEDANPLMVQRVLSAVEGHMSALGFRKVDTAPDIRIALRGTTREELSYTSWGDPYYYGWGWGWGPYPYWGGIAYPFWHPGGFSGVDVQTITIGTLTLDVIDGRTEKVVFRGTAEDRVSSKAKKNERKAYEAVAEIFEESPWGEDFDRD